MGSEIVVITVVAYPSMPNRYRVTLNKPGARVEQSDYTGAGDAAAKAMELAVNFSHYAIIAGDKVLQHIPKSLQSWP